MEFTEFEMTTAVTGVAKHYLAQIHPDKDAADFSVDSAWGEIDKFNRFNTLGLYGDYVLPVLVALPDVTVEPGTRPVYTDQQVFDTATQVDANRAAAGLPRKNGESAEDAVKNALLLTRLALRFVPVRKAPEDELDGFVVPDSLEGL